MTWLTEDPTMILVIGGMSLAALAVVLIKTGRAAVLVLMLVVALIVGALVLTEFLIVTDREKVATTLDAITDGFQANDADAVMAHLASDATQVRRRAAFVLNTVEIKEAKITAGPKITVHRMTSPPTADVELVALARGQLKKGSAMRDHYVAKLFIKFRLEDERWVVHDVEYDAPFGPNQR